MAKVKGLGQRTKRMRHIGGERAHKRRMAMLYSLGQRIELTAELSITQGSISGKDHVPSAPGEPPNADTRLLDGSIETTFAGEDTVHVTSNAPYSAALEFGTSKMEERPFMRPAMEQERAGITRDMAALEAKINRGG